MLHSPGSSWYGSEENFSRGSIPRSAGHVTVNRRSLGEHRLLIQRSNGVQAWSKFTSALLAVLRRGSLAITKQRNCWTPGVVDVESGLKHLPCAQELSV
mmetsp:Transcript_7766/g.15668  ORF Transcript_7766/g.15668 Transcript_7766/m.15668 type:complete len:99 (+) Transcript_7766:614-910(+)